MTARTRRALLLAALTVGGLQLAPAVAGADCAIPGPPDPTMAAPAQDFQGSFSAAQEGGFVLVPFDVPADTTAIRVRYCFDNPPVTPPNNTIDLGVYGPRPEGQVIWGPAQRRGWGGSSRRDIAIAVNGFSSPATYLADDDQYVVGRYTTTRAYRPGPIPAGKWAVELGLAAIAGLPDPDGVAWRVRVETSTDAQWASNPYVPDPFDPQAVRTAPGWYSGDFHVHGEQEPGNATTMQTLTQAFGTAGLDFVTLVDHNNDVARRGEVGRYQPLFPNKLVIPGVEVTTYDGHFNNQAQKSFVDYRTGPVSIWDQGTGQAVQVRGPTPAAPLLAQASNSGGFSQINHPTTFPESTFGPLCRGCAWEYSDAATGFGNVDAIEVHNGPAEFGGLTNPFTASAIDYYEHALDSGAHVAAVGSSDAHQGSQATATQAPAGGVATVVFAQALSEAAITKAVKADHTYVKLYGASGPDVRLTATYPGGPRAIIGDSFRGPRADLFVRVLGAGPSAARPGPYVVRILRNGEPEAAATVSSDNFVFRHTATKSGRYSVSVARTGPPEKLEVYSSPIWFRKAKPSNRFRILGFTRKPRKGSGVLRVRVPWAGTVRLSGGAVRFAERKPQAPRTVRLSVKLKAKARRRLERQGRLAITARVTFRPAQGDARSKRRQVTLTWKRPPRS